MELHEWILKSNSNNLTLYDVDSEYAERNTKAFQTDSNNLFGALISTFGGISVDGIIRIFGSTSDVNLRDICEWNLAFGCNKYIIIGDDVFGGVFAINLSLHNIKSGHICYFAPDSLSWESLDLSLTQFIGFLKNGKLPQFYSNIAYEKYCEIQNLQIGFNETLSIYPPQWSQEFKTSDWQYKAIGAEEYNKLLQLV